jgi:hypothetical protein
MGRSFESVRMGVNDLSLRWSKGRSSFKEGGSVLCKRARRHGKKALKLGILCSGRSPGDGSILSADLAAER